METPDPEESGSWLQRRGTDLAVWGLVILAIIGFAAGVAWLATSSRLALEVVEPDTVPLGEEPASGGPPAPTQDPMPPATTAGNARPRWQRVPSAEFPEQALAAGVPEGAVQLICEAEVSGRLSQCRILSETPTGYGFGANAVQAAEAARIHPRQVDGVAVRSTTKFTVRYQLAPEPRP